MTRFIALASLLTLIGTAVSAPVIAHEASGILAAPGRTVACYKSINVPPKTKVTRIKIKDHRLQYEKRNGRIELVDYPPVFKEIETVIEAEHILLRPIPCT